MSPEPIEPSSPTAPGTQEEYGWDRVAQEMHTWHPGLQEHARRNLEERGLLVASTGLDSSLQPGAEKYDHELEQPQDAPADMPSVQRLVRPTIDSMVESPIETKVIEGPEGIPISDALTDEMKKATVEEFMFGYGIDKDSMTSVDGVADILYDFCSAIMNKGTSLRKYALATIIARGLANTDLEDDNIYLLMRAPVMAEEKGRNPAEYQGWMSIFEALGVEAGIDPNESGIDYYISDLSDEVGTSNDTEKVIANKLYKELIEDLEEHSYFPESELGSAFEYGYRGMERDTLDMITVIDLEEGNKYFKRLLLRVFSEASQEDEKPVDVVEYYETAKSAVEKKIEEGIIPSAFGEKLGLYHPKEFVFEDKMTSLLNGKGHWAGYYQGELGRFAIVEHYEELLPESEELEGPSEFREPSTEGQYDKDSDYKLKVAIHELFHHLSGHSFVQIGGEIENRKVGLSTGSWGRLLNEAITERLASLVYPQAEQTYSKERAFLYALQANSGGLITDELVYDAYLEEREESGLPHLKKLIQTAGEAYSQKGIMQRVDKLFENEGYQTAIDYLRQATEATGRVFIDPLTRDQIAA